MPRARAERSTAPSLFAWLLLLSACVISCGCWDRANQSGAQKPPIDPSKASGASSVVMVEEDNTLRQPSENGPIGNESESERAETNSLSGADPTVVDDKPPVNFEPTGTWTTQRLVALASTGPMTIDLHISVDGKSLEESSADAAEEVVDELLERLEMPTWEALLELPLVQSGWIGNLIADDEEKAEQQTQLIEMYDANRDGNVDREELVPFLTRGLSRQSPLQIANGEPQGTSPGESPWGVADANRDNALGLQDELEQFETRVARLDIDEDGTITRQEALSTMEMAAATSMSRSQLESKTMLKIDGPQPEKDTAQGDEIDEQRLKQLRSSAKKLLDQYSSFLSIDVSRDQFNAWPDEWWRQWDSDQDQTLDSEELAAFLTGEAAVSLYVQLPGLAHAAAMLPTESGEQVPKQEMVAATSGTAPSSELHCVSPSSAAVVWTPNQETGGRLLAMAAAVRVSLTDDFSSASFSRLKMVLQQAINNVQLQGFLRNQLQLSENAFDVLDDDHDQQLSDAEFVKVLRWLAVRGGSRVIATGRTVGPEWFELVDTDADGRLTAVEIRAASSVMARLDADADGALTPYELPLLAELEIRRSDTRLVGLMPTPQAGASANDPADWYAAMDSNGDQVLSYAEFLGNREDFERFDQDKDGFVTRREVYAAP